MIIATFFNSNLKEGDQCRPRRAGPCGCARSVRPRAWPPRTPATDGTLESGIRQVAGRAEGQKRAHDPRAAPRPNSVWASGRPLMTGGLATYLTPSCPLRCHRTAIWHKLGLWSSRAWRTIRPPSTSGPWG